MRLPDWTRALIVCATVLLGGLIIYGVIWVLGRIGSIVLLVLLSGLLSIALMPVVDFFERWRYLPRAVAVLISYLLLAIVLGGVLYIIVPPLIVQANQLVTGLPAIVQALLGPNSELSQTLARFGINLVGQGGAQGSLGTQLQQLAQAVLSNAFTVVRDITTVLIGLVVVLVVAFYLLNEGHQFRARLAELVPADYQSAVEFVEDSVVIAVGGYVRAQLILAVMVGVLAGVSAWLVGIPYPLIIGALAGLFEMIPFFGPTLGALPAVIIALFQGDWIRVALIIVAFIIIQQIESNIVGPRITGRSVGLHPLAIIVAILVGVELAGIWGALFAVPVAAVLIAVGRRLYRLTRDQPRRMTPAA